jgi:YHS domain-containing protein
MFRALLYTLLALLVLTFVRLFAGIITRGVGQAMKDADPKAHPSPPPGGGGELKRDPVCGTYVAAPTALQNTVRGETYYYCSAHCRDRHSQAPAPAA